MCSKSRPLCNLSPLPLFTPAPRELLASLPLVATASPDLSNSSPPHSACVSCSLCMCSPFPLSTKHTFCILYLSTRIFSYCVVSLPAISLPAKSKEFMSLPLFYHFSRKNHQVCFSLTSFVYLCIHFSRTFSVSLYTPVLSASLDPCSSPATASTHSLNPCTTCQR